MVVLQKTKLYFVNAEGAEVPESLEAKSWDGQVAQQ
jgi:hypothetical protein